METAGEEKEMRVDIYIADAGSGPGRQERWTGYLMICNGKTAYGTECAEATENNAIITTIVAALDRFTRPADITIHIENEWIIGRLVRIEGKDGAMENNLDIWQRHGWKTARGTEVKNRNEWQRLYNKMRVFENSGATFQFAKLDKGALRDRVMTVIKNEKERS